MAWKPHKCSSRRYRNWRWINGPLRQRVYALALGYEDLNDHQQLVVHAMVDFVEAAQQAAGQHQTGQ